MKGDSKRIAFLVLNQFVILVFAALIFFAKIQRAKFEEKNFIAQKELLLRINVKALKIAETIATEIFNQNK
jgi:hypothetical protein